MLDVLVDPRQPTMAVLRSAIETIATADKETRPDVEDNKRPLYLKLRYAWPLSLHTHSACSPVQFGCVTKN